MSDWTPGPWFVDADYPCNVSTADHRTIAETCDSWFNLEISRANARLIAAAPELVAALEKVVALAQWMSGSGDFAPEGKAHEGWVKQRPDLFAAMSLLARVRGESEGGIE